MICNAITWDAIGAIAQLIAAVLTIFIVYYSFKSIKAQTRPENLRLFSNYSTEYKVLKKDFLQAAKDFSKPGQVEEFQKLSQEKFLDMSMKFFALLHLFSHQFDLSHHRHNLIDRDLFSIFEAGMDKLAKKEPFMAFWYALFNPKTAIGSTVAVTEDKFFVWFRKKVGVYK